MKIKCPNCGTEFVEGSEKYIKYNLSSNKEYTLIPKCIHNDNIKNRNEDNKMKTEETMDMKKLATLVLQMIEMNNASDNTDKNENNMYKNKNGWAKNSRLNGNTYCGFAFNPYMIRRFLPSQFMGLIREYNGNVSGAIRQKYSYMYTIKYTLEEVRKLSMLEKRDKLAFYERSKLFSLQNCKQIFCSYIDEIFKYIESYEKKCTRYSCGTQVSIFMSNYGKVIMGTVRETIIKHNQIGKTINYTEDFKYVINDLLKMKEKMKYCNSYDELYKTMAAFKLLNLGHDTTKSKVFIDCFIKSGAYYTLKQMIMFDNISFKNCKGRAAVILLRDYLNTGTPGYVIYAMLKEILY